MSPGTQRTALGIVLGVLAPCLGAVVSTPTVAASAQASGPKVISGTVIDIRGEPARNARVTVTKAYRYSDGFVGFVEALGCFLGTLVGADVCEGDRHLATTDSAGRFSVRLAAGSTAAEARVIQLRVSRRGSEFVGAISRNRTLPPIVLWRSTSRYKLRGDIAEAQHVIPSQANGRGYLAVRQRGRVTGDTVGAWEGALTDLGWTMVPAQIFESPNLAITTTAYGTWAGRRALWAAKAPSAPDAGPPGSRGLGCSTYNTNDALVPFPSCPFTDGRLDRRLGLGRATELEAGTDMCHFASDDCTANAIVFDLAGLRQPTAVILRNCSSCTIQLSADGTTWLAWQGQERIGSDYAVITGGTQPSRYVRVLGNAFITWDLAEVSIHSRSVAIG